MAPALLKEPSEAAARNASTEINLDYSAFAGSKSYPLFPIFPDFPIVLGEFKKDSRINGIRTRLIIPHS